MTPPDDRQEPSRADRWRLSAEEVEAREAERSRKAAHRAPRVAGGDDPAPAVPRSSAAPAVLLTLLGALFGWSGLNYLLSPTEGDSTIANLHALAMGETFTICAAVFLTGAVIVGTRR